MAEEDNGKPPSPPQPGQVPLNIQVTPQGMLLSCAYPVQFGIPAETMDNVTKQWVLSRPQLLLEIVQTAKAAQKQELLIIKHVNSRRND